MRQAWRPALVGAVELLTLVAIASTADAVEYRLQVVSIFQTAFVSFLNAGEIKDGASGPGLDRLEASLDRGDVATGAILFDRRVQPVRDNLARAYGGARVVSEIKPGGAGSVVWDEVAWDGKPGERSVWLLSPSMRHVQEFYNAALKGTGPLQYFQPYSVPINGPRTAVMALPLNFLWAQEERGTAWDRHLSRSLDLTGGIGAVVGVNFNALFPDQVYLIVSQAETPTTYKAVLAWRERKLDREDPGMRSPIKPR